MEKFESVKIEGEEVQGGLSFFPGLLPGGITPTYPTGWPFTPGSGPVNLADLI